MCCLRTSTLSAHRRIGASAGFTVVELLVVIGIVGLFMALALPAIMDARGAASRIHCSAKLRQLGVAVHQFVDVNAGYPRTFCGILQPANGPPRFSCFSATAELLPFLGEEALANLVRWDDDALDAITFPPDAGANFEAFPRAVRMMHCPADGEATGPACSFRFNRGIWPTWPADPGGLVVTQTRRDPASVADGLATTALASERLVGGAALHRRAILLADTEQTALEYAAQCILGERTGIADVYLGASWLRGSFRHAVYYHLLPPNSRVEDCVWNGPGNGLFSARSLHPQGVNVLFADGHVRFVGDGIDLRVWRALGTRAGGEAVSF